MKAGSLSMLDQVRLNKAAVDAGFDIKGEPEGEWLPYGSTSCPLRISLSVVNSRPVAALSMANVLAEFAVLSMSNSHPSEYAGAFKVSDFPQLQASLFHAYELSKTLPQELLKTWRARVRTLSETERQVTVLQRIGQDLFREGLLTLWNGRCAVSGLAVPALLRASHAKPWSCSSDEERLDVYNGLLLAAHFDAAFDQGLIAFTSDGILVVSDRLNSSDRALIGLDRTWPAIALRSQHRPYLEFHRENVFVDA